MRKIRTEKINVELNFTLSWCIAACIRALYRFYLSNWHCCCCWRWPWMHKSCTKNIIIKCETLADDAVGRVSESIVVQAKKNKRRNKEKTSYASIPEWLNIISDDTRHTRPTTHKGHCAIGCTNSSSGETKTTKQLHVWRSRQKLIRFVARQSCLFLVFFLFFFCSYFDNENICSS